MLKKIINLLIAVATCAALTVILSQACYADVKEEDVVIQCVKEDSEAKWRVYKGDSKTQMILTTLGIQVTEESGEKRLFPNWGYERDGVALVFAKCVEVDLSGIRTMNGKDSTEMMLSEGEDDNFVPETMPSLTCLKNESLIVSMQGPNDPNLNRYKYIGKLKKVID